MADIVDPFDAMEPKVGTAVPTPRMRHFPDDERLGMATSPDGKMYSCHFYGKNECAAVITGPTPMNAGLTGRLEQVPEVHREPAKDAADARAKLSEQLCARGWTWA